jgi:hypothetical protein
MDLLSLTIAISLPLSGGQFTGDYSFDVSPTIGLEAPTGLLGAGATTLPGVVLYDRTEVERLGLAGEGWGEILRHELMHAEQQRALGPAFWLAYGLTGGQGFEPHKEVTFVPSTTAAWGMAPRAQSDYSQMWMPVEGMRGRYPIFRIARDGATTRLQWMPGYPGLTFGAN